MEVEIANPSSLISLYYFMHLYLPSIAVLLNLTRPVAKELLCMRLEPPFLVLEPPFLGFEPFFLVLMQLCVLLMGGPASRIFGTPRSGDIRGDLSAVALLHGDN